MIIATQGHSTSFILQSITGQQSLARISPYNIAGLISEVSEEVATQIAKNNCSRRQPHTMGSVGHRTWSWRIFENFCVI